MLREHGANLLLEELNPFVICLGRRGEQRCQNKGEVIRLQLSENVTFLNKASILLTLHHLPDNTEVIIDGSKSTFIDYDVLDAI